MSLFAPMRRWLSAGSVYPGSSCDRTSPESVTAFFTTLDVSLNDIVSESVGNCGRTVCHTCAVCMSATLALLKANCSLCALHVCVGGGGGGGRRAASPAWYCEPITIDVSVFLLCGR